MNSNRINKLATVNEQGEGILSCSLAPYGDHNYEKLLYDIAFLRDCGLNQLLTLCYEPEIFKLAEIAPLELRMIKRANATGTYPFMYLDNIRAIRNAYPDLPIVCTPMLGELQYYGWGRFIEKLQELEVDAMDVPHYMAVSDPMQWRERLIEAGIHFLGAIDAIELDVDDPDHVEMLEKYVPYNEGEIFFVGGVPGTAGRIDGEYYKPKVDLIRSIIARNGMNTRIVAIGGMQTPEDCHEMVVKAGCDGVHFSSAFMKRILVDDYDDIRKWLGECKKAMKR